MDILKLRTHEHYLHMPDPADTATPDVNTTSSGSNGTTGTHNNVDGTTNPYGGSGDNNNTTRSSGRNRRAQEIREQREAREQQRAESADARQEALAEARGGSTGTASVNNGMISGGGLPTGMSVGDERGGAERSEAFNSQQFDEAREAGYLGGDNNDNSQRPNAGQNDGSDAEQNVPDATDSFGSWAAGIARMERGEVETPVVADSPVGGNVPVQSAEGLTTPTPNTPDGNDPMDSTGMGDGSTDDPITGPENTLGAGGGTPTGDGNTGDNTTVTGGGTPDTSGNNVDDDLLGLNPDRPPITIVPETGGPRPQGPLPGLGGDGYNPNNAPTNTPATTPFDPLGGLGDDNPQGDTRNPNPTNEALPGLGGGGFEGGLPPSQDNGNGQGRGASAGDASSEPIDDRNIFERFGDWIADGARGAWNGFTEGDGLQWHDFNPYYREPVGSHDAAAYGHDPDRNGEPGDQTTTLFDRAVDWLQDTYNWGQEAWEDFTRGDGLDIADVTDRLTPDRYNPFVDEEGNPIVSDNLVEPGGRRTYEDGSYIERGADGSVSMFDAHRNVTTTTMATTDPDTGEVTGSRTTTYDANTDVERIDTYNISGDLIDNEFNTPNTDGPASWWHEGVARATWGVGQLADDYDGALADLAAWGARGAAAGFIAGREAASDFINSDNAFSDWLNLNDQTPEELAARVPVGEPIINTATVDGVTRTATIQDFEGGDRTVTITDPNNIDPNTGQPTVVQQTHVHGDVATTRSREVAEDGTIFVNEQRFEAGVQTNSRINEATGDVVDVDVINHTGRFGAGFGANIGAGVENVDWADVARTTAIVGVGLVGTVLSGGTSLVVAGSILGGAAVASASGDLLGGTILSGDTDLDAFQDPHTGEVTVDRALEVAGVTREDRTAIENARDTFADPTGAAEDLINENIPEADRERIGSGLTMAERLRNASDTGGMRGARDAVDAVEDFGAEAEQGGETPRAGGDFDEARGADPTEESFEAPTNDPSSVTSLSGEQLQAADQPAQSVPDNAQPDTGTVTPTPTPDVAPESVN